MSARECVRERRRRKDERDGSNRRQDHDPFHNSPFHRIHAGRSNRLRPDVLLTLGRFPTVSTRLCIALKKEVHREEDEPSAPGDLHEQDHRDEDDLVEAPVS